MIHSIRNVNAIKVRSEELQIPFANLASACAIEEFFIRLEMSEYKKYLWLRNAGSLGLEHYRRKLVLKLEFFYKADPSVKADAGNIPGQALSKELLEVMLEELCKSDQKMSFAWEWSTEEMLGGYTASLLATLETIQIPIQIAIERLQNEKVQPNDWSLRLLMDNDRQIMLHQYPLEYIAADCIFEMIDKLELINDMSVYHKLYQMLKKEALDGRRVQQQLMEKCQEQRLVIHEKRLEMIKKYHSYTYMKKKWKSYLKAENKKEPQWEEVINLVTSFFIPIADMTIKDLIFIGDWMPELLRFLD